MSGDPNAEVRFTPTFDDLLAPRRLTARSCWWRYGLGAAACGAATAAVTTTSGDFSPTFNAMIAVVVGLGYARLLALIWRF